ncbi:CaiB/BaiF CoA transferase family protein [Patulibacter minatonensis]|uniref:CaiB/BaiF CoA transferase family protein n=1 Tax=Patulibacter minatonensis TaxID=298163 RepID=UPI00047E5E14|nr:CaiB/BaiF CoA-transferase family protein [Patulibacter minatonensis]
MSGPLAGIRVLEIAGIGPAPFAAMMLADMGAEVLRVDRAGPPDAGAGTWNPLNRGRRSVAVDLKHPDGQALVARLSKDCDALLEGFRPGVMERLGLGPDALLADNPRLVYGRMTGYGQDGPLHAEVGHDINYLAISGVLGMVRRTGDRPLAPLNLVADFGGGGMLLAFGVVSALLEARGSGRGQVVDAAMVEGSALLSALVHGMRANGMWDAPAGGNWLDSGAPWYEVYETADGEHLAIGALEPHFYAEVLRVLQLDDAPQWDQTRWPEIGERIARVVRTRTRDEWVAAFDGVDSCVSPVLHPDEAVAHPHNRARSTFIDVGGTVQPAPAPRFSRTPGCVDRAPVHPGADNREALLHWGLDAGEIDALLESKVLGESGGGRPGS